MAERRADAPLRVLHFIYDDPGNPWVGGGGARRLLELYRRLGDRVEATVATGSFPRARNAVRDGIALLRLGASWPYSFSRVTYAASARRLLRRAPHDAIVLDYSPYLPIGVPEAKPVGMRVRHLTGPRAPERWGSAAGAAVRQAEAALLRRARVLSAPTQWAVDEIRRIARDDAEILHVPAGVDDVLFDQPRDDAGYLLFIGRLDAYRKGLDVLLTAVALLHRRGVAVELRIAGRGSDDRRLRGRAERLGIRRQVRFLGFIPDAARVAQLAGAAALVLPSRLEGFGVAAAEAMAAGVPVLASDAGALPEIVGECGEFVPAGNADALADAISGLLAEPDRRRALGACGRGRAERFRWSAAADAHFAFLQRIAASKSPGSLGDAP